MMRIYQKNELAFTLAWIGLYAALTGAADALAAESPLMGGAACKAAVYGLLAAGLAGWIAKNGLRERYGLEKTALRWGEYLYFLPLAAIVSVGLWFGAGIGASAWETVAAIIAMACVGFIEEVLFRGFLFRALWRKNALGAAAASGLLFGAGHVVNLFSGGRPLAVLLQVCYASALGFLFAVIFYRSKSLIPCVIAHSAINVLSVFAARPPAGGEIAAAAAVTVMALAYAGWLLRRTSRERN